LNNTASGDNNTISQLDALPMLTMFFSQFGGPAVVAVNNAQTWTATYTIVAGSITASNRNVYVSIKDNAGNGTTVGDTTNAKVDNIAPTASALTASVSVFSPNASAGFQDTTTFSSTFTEATSVNWTLTIKNNGDTTV